MNYMESVIRSMQVSAKAELARRGFDVGDLQRYWAENNRRLMLPENEVDFYEGATPDQRERLDRLETIKPDMSLPHNRVSGYGGSRGPGMGGGGRQHRNSGRSIGS